MATMVQRARTLLERVLNNRMNGLKSVALNVVRLMSCIFTLRRSWQRSESVSSLPILSCLMVSFLRYVLHIRLLTILLPEKIKNAKPNLAVLKDYKKREEEFMRRAADLENVTERRDTEKQKHDTLCKRRLDEFMTGFNTISLKLKEMYQVRLLA